MTRHREAACHRSSVARVMGRVSRHRRVSRVHAGDDQVGGAGNNRPLRIRFAPGWL